GACFEAELRGPTVGKQYSQQNVTGVVNLNGATLEVGVYLVTPTAGTKFTIINNDLTDSVVGTFAGLPEGAVFQVSDASFPPKATFQITYHAADANAVF